ncbi:MAG: hypothetical protein RLO80_04615 [Hyphomonas sp.]
MPQLETEPDTSWMQPWEKWAWERIRAGEAADFEKVPVEMRGTRDAEKASIASPVRSRDGATYELNETHDWPEWQTISSAFVRRIIREEQFKSERQTNRFTIISAVIVGDIDFECEVIFGTLEFRFCHFSDHLVLRGASVSGDIFLAGCYFAREILAGRLRCKGTIFLSNGSCFANGVNLLDSEIDGNLNCNGCVFESAANDYSLSADRSRIRGNIFLNRGATFSGCVSFSGAFIGGQAQLWEGEFNGRVDLSAVHLVGELRLEELTLGMPASKWGPDATLLLRNAKIGAFQGSLDAWRTQDGFVKRNLDGLSVARLSGGVGGASLDRASPEDLIRWLEKDIIHHGPPGSFSPSPYVAFASALEDAGASTRARKVRISLEKRVTSSLRWFSFSAIRKIWRRFVLSPISAYGYEPSRVIWWFAGVVIVFGAAGLSWEILSQPEYAIPSLRDAAGWLGFSFETALPIIELDPVNDTFLEDRFGVGEDAHGNKLYEDLPDGLRALFVLERLLGLVILSVLIAGLSGWAETRGK